MGRPCAYLTAITLRVWLEKHRPEQSRRDRILEQPAYRKAQNTGYAVTETGYVGLNAKADALIQAMIDEVGDNG